MKDNPDSTREEWGAVTEPEDGEAILTELCNQGVDLPGILHYLSGLETAIYTTPAANRGEAMVKALIKEDNPLFHLVTMLPRGIPTKCKPVLLVAVGSRMYEDVEKRILQAIAHVFAASPNTTKTVIFWAAKWNSIPWLKYRTYFNNTMVVLKTFGANPILLH